MAYINSKHSNIFRFIMKFTNTNQLIVIICVFLIPLVGCQSGSKNPNELPSPASLSEKDATTQSSLDIIQGIGVGSAVQPIVFSIEKERGTVTIDGWAVDSTSEDISGGVYVNIDGNDYPAIYGSERMDVMNAYKKPNYRYCGFRGIIPTSKIGPGVHKVSIKVLTKDQKEYYKIDPSKVVSIKIGISG
jgi:hypothetical protein